MRAVSSDHPQAPLFQLAQEARTWSRWTTERRQQVREAIGELSEDWELITSSGIIRQGIPGIFPPGDLDVPFCVADLQCVFPELVSTSKLDP